MLRFYQAYICILVLILSMQKDEKEFNKQDTFNDTGNIERIVKTKHHIA